MVIVGLFFVFFQLKDMAEQLPPISYGPDTIRMAQLPNGLQPNGFHAPDTMEESHARPHVTNGSNLASFTGVDSGTADGSVGPLQSCWESYMLNENDYERNQGVALSNITANQQNVMLPSSYMGLQRFSSSDSDDFDSQNFSSCVSDGFDGEKFSSCVSDAFDCHNSASSIDGQNIRLQCLIPMGINKEIEAEWIKRHEPGLYITLGSQVNSPCIYFYL